MAEVEAPQLTDKPKKRPRLGSKFDAEKKKRLSSHITGPNCNCTRHRCFEITSDEERKRLIELFNEYQTKDQQDAFLSTLVQVKEIKRRRPRENSSSSIPNECSYAYTLKINRTGRVQDVTVCAKGFTSVFGITERRLRTVKHALSTLGRPPTDQRGKHGNRPHKLSEEVKTLITSHISSFRGRMSHYSRGRTRKLYLDAELNISKMFHYFKELNPDCTVGYDTYRNIFNENFNISFGYPRSDTCSKCDEISAEIHSLDLSLKDSPDNPALLRKKASLCTDRELHHRKAETFYSRKRDAKIRAQGDATILAAAFDFQKDLPIPNKTTNDVYYRRQLTLHSFNIHELANDGVTIYWYDERVAKKGANDVASMLHRFMEEKVPSTVNKLELFCDSCGGQNKNFTVFRFLFYMVHIKRRFDSIKVTFPIRGHSYMECDRDLAIVNKKSDVELPCEWADQFRQARCNPHPYDVIEMNREQFFNFSDFLKPMFKVLCPFKTRPIRELLIRQGYPGVMHFRANWNSLLDSAAVIRTTKPARSAAIRCAASLPPMLYTGIIPISRAKYQDLQVLKRFCKPENRTFYDSLMTDVQIQDALHEEDSQSDSEDDI